MHCGAACPAGKLGLLLDLLRPEGGLIVTPVEPSDLRVILKKPDGSVTSRIISQVRYSTLEVRSMLSSFAAKGAHAAGQELLACFLSPGKLQSAHQRGIASIWRGSRQRLVECIRRLGVRPGVD